tara:strand:- start:407 stop:730 length:324 start_codon:yes stop_codon:yes gene_type:complete
MKTNEELLKENAELRAIVINTATKLAESLEDHVDSFPDNGVQIPTWWVEEFLDKAPAQHLADIKADAVIEMSQHEMTVARLHNGTKRSFVFASDIHNYANKLRGESK